MKNLKYYQSSEYNEEMKRRFKLCALEYEKTEGKGGLGASLAWSFYKVLDQGYHLTDLDEFRFTPYYTGSINVSGTNKSAA